jgi:hypothetical protein
MSRGADGGAAEQGTDNKFAVIPPQVSLPKGGGSIRGIGEKFAANPVTGTGSMTVPPAPVASRAIGFYPRTMAGPASRLWGAFIRWTLAAPMPAGHPPTAFTSYGRKASIVRGKRMRRLVVADRNRRILGHRCIPTLPRPPTRKRRDISALSL